MWRLLAVAVLLFLIAGAVGFLVAAGQRAVQRRDDLAELGDTIVPCAACGGDANVVGVVEQVSASTKLVRFTCPHCGRSGSRYLF